MKKICLVLLLTWICQPLLAQKQATHQHKPTAETKFYVDEQVARASFELVNLGKNYTLATLEKYLNKTIPTLANSELVLLDKKESPVGRHYHFQQFFQGKAVYSGLVSVNMDKHGTIMSVFDNTFDFTQASVNLEALLTKEIANPENSINEYLRKKEIGQTSDYQKVIFPISATQVTVGINVEVGNLAKGISRQVILDEKGNVIYQKSKVKQVAPPQTTIEAIGYVFNPDPITTAGDGVVPTITYGGPYIDNDDANTPELNAERVEVTMDVTFENGTYLLENEYVRIKDTAPPLTNPTTSTNGVFDFGRGDDGFEEVMVFYHINTFQDYLQSIGFDNLNDRVQVDALATTAFGDDNSVYINNGGSNHCLLFGHGNVDDAEDADVIIHEYAHSLSQQACRDCAGLGSKARATLEEGLADYFAASYSRSLTEHNWEKMFGWDGHNPFFAGRNMINVKHYPEDLQDDIHSDSEIWSAVMMEIWTDLGQEITDQLMFSALYNFTRHINMKQAAVIIVQQNQLLNDGEKEDLIIEHFIRRGLWDFSIEAGEDRTVCLGDSTILGGETTLIDGMLPFWSPGYNLVDSTVLNPIAKPDAIDGQGSITTYVLSVLDETTGVVLRDSVEVTVNYCFPNDPPTSIRLLNTDRFLQGRGNIIVEIPPETTQVTIDIFDTQGRILQQLESASDERLEIESRYFTTGLYILKIKTDNQQAFFKVSRVQ